MTQANELPPATDTRRDKAVTWILRGIAAAAIASTGASFYESFAGLVGWFRRLGFHGIRAYVAPGMIDLVALAGEAIAVLVIIELAHKHKDASRKVRAWAWLAIGYGLALSVVGNAGQDGVRHGPAGLFDMAWNAVPPVSMAILMAAVLAVVKVRLKPPAAADDDTTGQVEDLAMVLLHFPRAFDPATEPPGYRPIKDAASWGTARAQRAAGLVRQVRETRARLVPVASLNGDRASVA